MAVAGAEGPCPYVMTATQKSPKAYRFTFVSRMQNLALDVVEQAFRANDVYVRKGNGAALERRASLQHAAITSAKPLCYVAMLAMEHGCILMKQYEQIARLGADVSNLMGAWITSDNKRFSPDGAQTPTGL